jgi:hypothetical protein
MNTVEDIIKIAKISQYLTQNDIENKGLYGGGTDLFLPKKIYNIRKSVEWANDNPIVEVDAIGYIKINSSTGSWNSIEIFVNDPILGTISFGKSYYNNDNTPSVIAAGLYNGSVSAATSYGYIINIPPTTLDTIKITAPAGRGAEINGGNNLYVEIL